MIGDQRAADAPPVDSLAEAIVLSWLVMHPELADGCDIGRLLVFPEHRWIWQAVQRTRQLYPETTGTVFFGHWLEDVQQAHPDHWLNLIDLLWPADTQSFRAWQEYDLARERDPDAVLLQTDFQHSFDWWFARLKTIAEMRKGIRAAQHIAEGYWRGPDEPFSAQDAHALLRRMCPVHEETVGMEVPL